MLNPDEAATGESGAVFPVVQIDSFEPEMTTRIPRLDPQLRWMDGARSCSCLLGGRLVVGSAEAADIVVRIPGVGRLHASLEVESDGVWVRDLGTPEGTFIEGIKVLAARVPDGGRIQLGQARLSVHYAQNETEVEIWPYDRFGPLVGRSTLMRELFARIHRVAQLDSTVLIQGETGTGKELVARAIHMASPRKDKAFVVVDCGALTESLLEAELFGHTRGAFTGAATARQGAVEAADGGTLFLDEIGEMPLSMQPKLLRALEGHMVRRIGETSYRDVNVRFIAATHRDLAAMVNAGSFREDLFFRLAVLPIAMPPLRARKEDIPLLAESLMPPAVRERIGPELLRELTSRAWTGNVRELRNFLERAVALGTREAIAMSERDASEKPLPAPAPSLPPPGLPAELAAKGAAGLPSVSIEEGFKAVRDRWLDHLEREYMRAMVARHNRDTGAIAQASGLDRSYIYRLIRKHGL
jgi:transcriptional regulator with GAF, ATPase, and Fis domain